jgi:nucleoid-associated protein YgaU
MSHRFSHAVEGEPEPPVERQHHEPQGTRILWGRTVVLLVVLLLVFAAGWAAAPTGAPGEAVAALRAELSDARSRIEALEEEAAAEEPEPTPTAPAEPEAEQTPIPEAEGETYVVRPGDTLQSIAERFYEDPTLDDVIAEANDISDPARIFPGLELLIPERSEL